MYTASPMDVKAVHPGKLKLQSSCVKYRNGATKQLWGKVDHGLTQPRDAPGKRQDSAANDSTHNVGIGRDPATCVQNIA